MEYFANSLQQILFEIERLQLLVQVQVWRARQLGRSDPREPATPSEMALWPLGEPRWGQVTLPGPLAERVQAHLDALAAQAARARAASEAQGIPLALETLVRRFGLTAFDRDALLICLAPALDLRFLELYEALQGEVPPHYPSVALLLQLLCPHFETQVAQQARLAATAPLRAHHLLRLLPPAGDPDLPFPAHGLKLDERIRRYLLEEETFDERLLSYASLESAETPWAALILPAEVMARLQAVAAYPGPQILYFRGPYGSDRQRVAAALACSRGQPLLHVQGDRLPTGTHLLSFLAREARLQNALLYWEGFDTLLRPGQEATLATARALLDDWPGLVVLAGREAWQPRQPPLAIPYLQVSFPRPPAGTRRRLWQEALGPAAADVDLAAVAAQFRLGSRQIREAAETARTLARWRDPAGERLETADLFAASRLHAGRELGSLAQKIRPHHTWEQLVLPPAQLAQLRQLGDHVRQQAHVYEQWGFARQMALGKGISALFTGEPGTGKTMAAGILAGELGLDLYKIDLSAVVSKYIGETEKNLARIFAEAESTHAILFFDEADALFGKRTEVKDAHDRYANLEVSYLLQRMEAYEGVVILATNLRENMDRAFVRRIRFIVEFPLPQAEARRRIWEGIWPAETPLAPDVDLGLLATHVDVPGGNIRNIALTAAFLAAARADDNGQAAVTMAHLLEAVEQEYKKIGRLLTSPALKRG